MSSKSGLDIEVTQGDSIRVTNDLIHGYVCLKFEDNASIDNLSITFEGKARTRVEKHVLLSNNAGHTCGDHNFLRMSQSVQPADMPKDGVARRDQSYIFPFKFRVPEVLLPYVCTHALKGGNAVRRAHLLLPPSLGKPFTSSSLADHSGPSKARINYAIHATVRRHFSNGTSVILKKEKPIWVLPRRHEQPTRPLSTGGPYYRLSQEKNVSQGPTAFGERGGQLGAEIATLPSSVIIDHSGTSESSLPLRVSVNLVFSPATIDQPPPQLESIIINLHSFTFYGAMEYEDIPRPEKTQTNCDECTQHMDSFRLGNYCLRDTAWVRHPTERSQATEEEAVPYPSNPKEPSPSTHLSSLGAANDVLPCYKSSLQIPIQLPPNSSGQHKVFLTPTFSSCLISRMYSLEIVVAYKNGGLECNNLQMGYSRSRSILRRLVPATHLTLKMPLHIQVGAGTPPAQHTSASEDRIPRPESSCWLDSISDDGSAEEQLPTYTYAAGPR